MISLATIGSTIANNRAVQYALGVGILVLSFMYWLAQHDRRLLKNERMRTERNARIKQDQIRKSNDEKSTQVERARASAPRGITTADELRDDISELLIRD